MDIIQLIVILAAVSFFSVVVRLTSKNKLTDHYAFMWLSFSVIGLILAFTLPFINQLASNIGIAYMPSLIFLLAFLVILLLLIYHTQLLSKQEARVRILVQEVAFLRNELQSKQREDQTK